MGHLEHGLSMDMTPKSLNVSASNIAQSRTTSSSNILSQTPNEGTNKQLSVIITSPDGQSPIGDSTPLASLSPDLIIESDSEDDMDGNLIMIDPDNKTKSVPEKSSKSKPQPVSALKMKTNFNRSSQLTQPKLFMSKSANAMQDRRVDEVPPSPPVLKQKTYSSTPGLPTVLSSGDEEPYMSGNSMISMPLYSESVATKTPKQVLEIPNSNSTSPIQIGTPQGVLEAMEENKERIISANPMLRS